MVVIMKIIVFRQSFNMLSRFMFSHKWIYIRILNTTYASANYKWLMTHKCIYFSFQHIFQIDARVLPMQCNENTCALNGNRNNITGEQTKATYARRNHHSVFFKILSQRNCMVCSNSTFLFYLQMYSGLHHWIDHNKIGHILNLVS